jgi:thioredoxin 1
MNQITTSEFQQLTSPKGGKQVIVFSATWCGPCKMLTPVLERLSQSYNDVGFSKVDIEQEQDLTVGLGISGVPTIMFYDNGELKHKHVGAAAQTVMKSYIDTHLG